MTLQEIETKILAILGIKELNTGLSSDEKITKDKLESRYRLNGNLKKGSYFINSDSRWVKV